MLISAALSSQGVPAKLVRFALSQRILHDFNASARWVAIGEPEVYCRDREDDQFFETALVAHAAVLIAGDKDLLDAPKLADLEVLTPLQAAAVFVV